MKEAPRLISRRRLIAGSAAIVGAGLADAACGGSPKKPVPTNTVPAVEATQFIPAPTEVPATSTPEKPALPLVPEKYDFGPDNEYARFYPNGFFTGVEKGRAEETHISYDAPWQKTNPTKFEVDREVIKGLEVNDPAALEAALYISEALRMSMINKTDDNGTLTVEDFDREKAAYDALVAEGKTPTSKIRGVAIVNEPPTGLYTTQNNSYSKQSEEGFDRITAEIFLSSGKVSDQQTLLDSKIALWCAANAQNQLDSVNEPFVVAPEYTAAKLASLGKKFQTLFTPESFTLVP